MADGAQEIDSSYDWEGKTYQLEEISTNHWTVFDGERYLGVIIASELDEDDENPLPNYESRLAGEETESTGDGTDDWRSALEDLLDATA